MQFTRRSMTTGLAASGLLAGIPRVLAQAPLKFTLAHNSPPSSPKGMGATKFAELVAAQSGGKIAIHVAPSEQLGNENTNMSALRTGTLDFGSFGQGALLSVVPEVAAIGLPFLFSNLPEAWAIARRPRWPGSCQASGVEGPRLSVVVVQRHPANHQQQAGDYQAGRFPGPQNPHAA